MQSHQRDLSPLLVSIGIADQSSVIQKLIEGFAAVFRIHRGVDQFVNVLNPRKSFRRIFFFKKPDVSSAVDQEFQNLGNVGGTAWSAKAFDGLVRQLFVLGWVSRPVRSGVEGPVRRASASRPRSR